MIDEDRLDRWTLNFRAVLSSGDLIQKYSQLSPITLLPTTTSHIGRVYFSTALFRKKKKKIFIVNKFSDVKLNAFYQINWRRKNKPYQLIKRNNEK